MKIYDGNKFDTTEFISDKYLQINSCGFQNVMPGYTVIRRNGRNDFHILMIIDGKCEVLHNGKLYTLNKGNFVIYAPREEQRYTFKTESTSLWCHFTGSIIREVFASYCIKSGVYFLPSNKLISEAFINMIQRFHQPSRAKFANVFFLELIYNISDAVTKSTTQGDAQDFILPILTYINANYNKKITLCDLAQKSGYSKSRFSHIFSENTGTTPIKYQNDIRLKISCEMLSSTSSSITDIAFSCGFNDPLYFSRLFKKKYNVTPSKYRELHMN